MLAHVSPTTEMFQFGTGDYGPKTEEFDPLKKVWTVRYKREDQSTNLHPDELIFSFYGSKPPTSPESVVQAFVKKNDHVQILGQLQVADEVTKSPAYIILSETRYKGDPFALVTVSKTTSLGRSAYTVTFSKRISGISNADLEKNLKSWLSGDEVRAIELGIVHVGVDTEWQGYLTEPPAR
jgi:hypothetical protein